MTKSGNQATRQQGSKRRPKQRRIAVVTGTRAEYGLLRSTMTALQQHRNVTLQVVVTGSHLLPKFGHTIDEIIADGWRIDARVPMQRGDDDPLDQAAALARGVAGIARFLHNHQTDIAVVLGDRIEAMAGALAAVTTGRVLAHVHGGDLAAGDFDDTLRHSITKLAHLHFPATRDAARRIIRMGEAAARVHVVGAPGLDRIGESFAARQTASPTSRSGSHRRSLHPKEDRYALILQHPCGRSRERERTVMNNVLRAVQAERFRISCLYPNTDRGHQGIIDAIRACAEQSSNGEFHVVRSLPRDDFLVAMHEADVLVGNSSSGIIEAASVGTPTVNIGLRHAGRQVSGSSVVHCTESLAAIRQALRRAMKKRTKKTSSNVYGDGHAGERIAKTLARIPFDEKLRRKLNSY